MAPGEEALKASAGGDSYNQNGESIGQTEKPKALLGNVVMDKIVLKNAFKSNAFERERKSEYGGMSLIGSMKTFHEEDDMNHAVEEQKQRQNNIWRIAMSQMAKENQEKGANAPSVANLGFAGQVKLLKQAYDQAQNAKDADQETSNAGGKARFKRIAHRYKDVVKNENEVSSAKSSTEL